MSSNKVVTLYGFTYGDRSGQIRWLFEELGVTYEDHLLSWEARENRSAEYLKMNPMGRIPTVKFGGRAMQESGAIVLTFADLYPEKALAPAVGSPNRMDFYQWLFFASATLEPMLEKMWRAKESKNTDLENITREELKGAAIVLESGLSGKDYLIGNEFSAADIMVGSLLNWGDTLIKMSPVFKTYFERLKARPACKRSRIFI
jgi:glutathione S-transferase